MLQVGFGYPALIAGCMMAPTAMGSILAKSLVTQPSGLQKNTGVVLPCLSV
jgi:hypothetical protein